MFETENLCGEKKCKGHSCHFSHIWLEPTPLYRVKDIYYLMTNLLPIDRITLVVFDKDSYILHIELLNLENFY